MIYLAASDQVTVVPVTHICGNGVLTTAERCDDGARIDGDGCTANCTIEPGYRCNGGLGATSNCYVPVDPMLGWKQDLFGPFQEGTVANLTVRPQTSLSKI